MTLIATFSIDNNPVMIGDILLSRTGAEMPHSKIPMIDDVSDILPIEWQRIVSGLHRKVCIINPNLVLGWTGSLLYCSHFVHKIKSLCMEPQPLSESYLEDILQKSKVSLSEYSGKNYISSDEITIIGWFKSNNISQMFEWNWDGLKVVSNSNVLARGSGAHEFYNLISEQFPLMQNGQSPVGVKCIQLISTLIATEVTTGANILALYGGGYDIVIDTNKGFQYLSDIQYIPIFIENMRAQQVRVPIPPKLYFKYFYIEGNLAIARKILLIDQQGKIKKDEVTISIIGDFGVSRKKLESFNLNNYYSFNSETVVFIFITDVSKDYYNCYLSVHTNGKDIISIDDKGIKFSKKVYQEVIPKWNKELSDMYGW